ncbi:MAG: selenocysteine-specific translation elongation factor [Myxococcales bacterium]|nr:selenocysteine-specific translation elongation factor [Myxococcales bacterium]
MSTRRLVMGTAGHIDHGKTSLIKMLTGVDCDRLPEEKARGITIELGFTHLELPSGFAVGVVDVPGHERFVRAMVAGAAGIDFVLFVVAADEGVMPQTREHFAICRLLGLRHGLIALTKADLVDDEMLTLVKDELAELTAGTFLAAAPVVPVSAVTGAGREAIRQAIDDVARAVVERSDSGIFRLPIDRVFTIKGFGTVVTGTCIGGQVAVGDEVEILPEGRRARVRGLQVHEKPVEAAYAGQRTAVNLQGIELQEVSRGAMLATPDVLTPTQIIDVETELLPEAPRPIKHRSLVRVHCYTREVMARAVPLNFEVLEAGQTGLLQLRLAEPLIALPGDRFVLRSYSPVLTVGGGTILNSQANKHRAPYAEALADLQILRTGTLADRLAVHYRQAGRYGRRLARLAPLVGLHEKGLREEYQKLLSCRRIVRIDADTENAVDAEVFAALQAELLELVAAHHRDHPYEPGISRAELLGRAGVGAEAKVVQKALSALAAEKKAVIEGNLVHAPTHDAAADEAMQRSVARLHEAIRQAGMAAPTYKELQETEPDPKLLDQALAVLTRESRIRRVGPTLFYDAAVLAEAQERLTAYLAAHGDIDAQGMKTLYGISRKWTIPLAEYFDAQRLTLRVGDKRTLRRMK